MNFDVDAVRETSYKAEEPTAFNECLQRRHECFAVTESGDVASPAGERAKERKSCMARARILQKRRELLRLRH